MFFLLNVSLYRNETCDPEKITSFIHHHIPEAKLKAESKEKLVYSLPLEKTNVFPGNFNMLVWNGKKINKLLTFCFCTVEQNYVFS